MFRHSKNFELLQHILFSPSICEIGRISFYILKTQLDKYIIIFFLSEEMSNKIFCFKLSERLGSKEYYVVVIIQNYNDNQTKRIAPGLNHIKLLRNLMKVRD